MHSMNSKLLFLLTTAAAVFISANAWPQPASGSATAASGASVPATGKKADRALRRKVYAAIGKSKEIDAGNISVMAKDGAITLYGTVAEASQIDKVADIAKGVQGVVSVSNRLTVRKPLGGM
jgi:hyperosmotically inducible periplasmic protein